MQKNTTVLVILAGGKSSRMGSPKGLLDYFGDYWILEQIQRFKKVDNPVVYIGLGYDYTLYFEAIPWLKEALETNYIFNGVGVRVVLNKQPELGAFSTLQTVLKKVNTTSDVLVLPIDVPLLNTKELQVLIDTKNSVVIPQTTKKGHPVKLSASVWNELLHIDCSSQEARLDSQIKKLETDSVSLINVIDTAVNQNINTKDKWVEYKKSATFQ